MKMKLIAGILGATGMVGQKYLALLENHPWFKIAYLAASERSAGKKYSEAVRGRGHMQGDIPKGIEDLVVGDANDFNAAWKRCDFVFSALEMDKDAIKKLEMNYAKLGIPVVSNCSAHRFTEDIPMLIPEINPEHINIIPEQRRHYKFDKGFIVVKPNCSIQSFMIPVYALMKAGYNIGEIDVTTQQALSGAGYPGVSGLDILDNRIPSISGEEEKTEREPLKIFGTVLGGKIVNRKNLKIAAQCNRDNVYDGHSACVKLRFNGEKPCIKKIIEIWRNFKGVPQELELPFAPKQAIIYKEEENRPQPKLDRDADKGMAVSVGRLREFYDGIMFVGLSNNIVRGAAGGGILNAELLRARGYF